MTNLWTLNRKTNKTCCSWVQSAADAAQSILSVNYIKLQTKFKHKELKLRTQKLVKIQFNGQSGEQIITKK